jgi:WD40 repeat protein
MAAEAPRHGAFDPGGQKIQQNEIEDEKRQQEVNVCALCFSSRCDCRASVWAHFDGKLGRTTSHVVAAVRIDVFVLQAQQVGFVTLQHEDHNMVTAVCCLPCKLGVHHNVVTATTTGIVRPTYSIHIWRLSESVAPHDRQGNISCNALALDQSRKASCTFAEKHQNAITSICAVPAAVVSLTHAAFVTCSKGSDTPSDDHGTIRLWTKGGAAVLMKLHEDDSITKLPCEASVAKVIVTVDQNGDTLIAAYFAARSTGIELWNITTGLKRKWDHTGIFRLNLRYLCMYLYIYSRTRVCIHILHFIARRRPAASYISLDTMCADQCSWSPCVCLSWRSSEYDRRRYLLHKLGEISTIAFSSQNKEIISCYNNGCILRCSARVSLSTDVQYSVVTNTVLHMVYSAEGQYLATVTPGNEIRIWREQRNGGFKQYAQIAGTTQSTIMTIQFDTAAMSTSGEKRVILLVLSEQDQHYHLRTYDMLSQQEIREPVAVIHPHISNSNLLVDISGYLECVVSAARGGTLIRVIVMKHSGTSAIRRFHDLLPDCSYIDAVQLFKEHPAVAFQPFTTRGNTLIEYALTSRSDNSKQLLCLLDPDAAVLGGEHLTGAFLHICYVKLLQYLSLR